MYSYPVYEGHQCVIHAEEIFVGGFVLSRKLPGDISASVSCVQKVIQSYKQWAVCRCEILCHSSTSTSNRGYCLIILIFGLVNAGVVSKSYIYNRLYKHIMKRQDVGDRLSLHLFTFCGRI